MEPTPEAIAQAKLYPDGWVYAIDGDYTLDEAVPPQAIRGAWKVDANGVITGEFIPNHKFIPNFPKPRT